MAIHPELFVAVNKAIEEKSLAQARAAITRPLNEMAMAGAADLSKVKPAVRHPLGFYTLYLADNTCIHWWPVTCDEPDFPDITTSPIHRHSMGVNSIILDGALINTSGLEVKEEPFSTAAGLTERPGWMGDGSYFRLFDAQSGANGVDIIRNTNRIVRVTNFGEDTTYEAGQAYEVLLGDYHMSEWNRDSLTLMTADQHPGEPNFTLGSLVAECSADEVDTHVVQRHILTAAETAAVAARIAIRLGLDG